MASTVAHCSAVNSSCASTITSDFSLATTGHPSLSLNIEKIEVYLFSMRDFGRNQLLDHLPFSIVYLLKVK
jgi:hypothetical protein